MEPESLIRAWNLETLPDEYRRVFAAPPSSDWFAYIPPA